MNKRKIYLYAVFQISFIVLILNLFYFNQFDLDIVRNISIKNSLIIFTLLIVLKLLLALLFFFNMNIIVNKKIGIVEIINIFLQGGLVSVGIPGLGLVYKYQKFASELDISLAEYSSCQTLSTFFSIVSYFVLAIFLGFLTISITFKYNPYIIIFFILALFLIFAFKIRRKILYFTKIKKIYSELSNIKKTFINNYSKFIFIFISYIFISFLQCYAFFQTVLLFDFDLSFINTSYLYISSTIITLLSIVNFIGFFELILSLSASLIIENYIDIIIVGFGFRLLNISSLIAACISIFSINKFKKN